MKSDKELLLDGLRKYELDIQKDFALFLKSYQNELEENVNIHDLSLTIDGLLTDLETYKNKIKFIRTKKSELLK